MAKYLFVYHGGSMPETEAEGMAVMAQWQAWFEQMGPAVVDAGNPVGLSSTVQSDGIVEANGGSNPVSGYSIISTDSQDAAETLAQGCPIRERGGSIEIAEIMEM
jgi:hypothetical protein